MTYATVYGSPGARVRFLGLADIYWPFLAMIFLAGWFLQAALPVAIPRWASGAALALLAVAAWFASDRCSRRFGNYLKGAYGEEIVARELAVLPAGWTIFHGVPRPGLDPVRGGADYDHVVLGPCGLVVVETKNWSGPLRIENGTVSVVGVRAVRSPVVQARREAAELARSLRGLLPEGLPVLGLVCFASDGLEGDGADIDGTPVCNVRVLRERLLALPAAPIDDELRARLVSNLLARR